MQYSPDNNVNFVSAVDRRLARAHKHVSDLWLPPNPEQLKSIRQGMQEQRYEFGINFLLNEIKNDLGLYTYCLREMCSKLREEGVSIPPSLSPTELLEFGGLARLKQILAAEDGEISRHLLIDMDDNQAARLAAAIISASAVEALAEHSSIDPSIAHSTALFRQLGLTLIAWNYPGVYERALAMLKERQDTKLEDFLTEILGFSPSLLGLSIVKDWALSPEIKLAMGANPSQAGPEIKSTALMIDELCHIGECLARANDPERYPSAQREWENVRTVLEAKLGTEALKIIRAKVKANCAAYQQAMPELFDQVSALDPDLRIRAHNEETLLQRNPHIKACPPILRSKLKELYIRLGGEPASKENLNFLVKQVIPHTGFSAGCIYTVDPTTVSLVPRLKFGEPRLLKLKSVSYGIEAAGSDPIVTAYHCTTPLVEDRFLPTGEVINYTAAALGSEKKVGVLYVEMPRRGAAVSDSDQLQVFKAIRLALNDCLRLR